MDEHDDLRHLTDPLELELSSYRPMAPSGRLSAGIAENLSSDRRMHIRRKWLILSVTGVAAAACVVASLLLWREPSGSNRGGVAVMPHVPTIRQSIPPLAPPTSRSYEQAFADSPEAFEELLDRHAERLLRSADGSEPVQAFTPSRTNLHELIGDEL